MPNTILSSDIRHFAITGAEARLLQLSEETAAIHRLFPELRKGYAQNAESAVLSRLRPPRHGRRRAMSAAERNAVSARMKKYWAARRAGTATATTAAAEANESPKTKVARAAKGAKRGAAKRGSRRMSPEARKRISDGQKARWAKPRGVTVARGSESAKTSAKGRRGTAKGSSRGPANRGPRKRSAAARKRMSQAQKKRWAAKRKAA